jgi:hypothetical protein
MAQGPPYYLTPGDKWLPIHYWPESWQKISSPPAFDEFGNRVAPKPPEGKAVYWWLQPKETWPYRDEMPWEQKVLGAWPSSKVTMSDDLRYIWPGKQRPHPPWGYIKLVMSGTPDFSGDQTPKGNQILFNHFKIHMRWISPDEVRVMTALTPLGPRYYLRGQNWDFKELEYKQFRRVVRERRQARAVDMLAREIARTGGVPKPSADLFE